MEPSHSGDISPRTRGLRGCGNETRRRQLWQHPMGSTVLQGAPPPQLCSGDLLLGCELLHEAIGQEEREAFSVDYKRQRATHPKGGKKGAGKGLPRYPPLPSTIPQERARQFVPPGGHIWRGLQTSHWGGHLPPYSRCSARWKEYGEEEAMRVILRTLWRQWCEKEGKSIDACPLAGLFDTQ